MTIKKRGSKFVLVSKKTGEKISEHKTRESAEKQERAINIAKARKAGHRIPKK